ncbi:YqzM family protein [Paenibacillus crassostreae]|uniref:YqzM family protein n=1 Tax=Paenibacillus crassostreae TaxID=1763538 RepID=UPI000B11D1BE|nr:YqzM family protein [Paenibacillus crassostreae]
MEANVHLQDPREHVNEEPRDDFGDLMAGFGGMFLFMAVLFFGMVIIKFIITG